MGKSRIENVALNTGAGFAMRLTTQIMQFVLKTVFIHTLGIQYAGVSTLFSDILKMFALAELGIGTAITYALYKPIRDKDYRRIGQLMDFYKKAYRLISLIVLAAGLVCLPFLPMMVKNVPNIQEDIRVIFLFFVADSACSYLLIYKSTLLTASERRYVISKIEIVFVLIQTAVQCLMLVFFKNYLVYLGVIIAMNLCKNLVISRAAGKAYPQIAQYGSDRLSKDETRKLLGDVGALSLYKVCSVVVHSTDSIIIAAAPSLGVISVGYLSNYRLIVNTIDQLLMQFFGALNPSLGNMAIRAEEGAQYKVFRSLLFMTFWCTCFCCTSLFTLMEPFIRHIWLGKDFLMPLYIPGVLVFNFYLTSMSRPLSSFRTANGLFVQGKLRPLAMAILNVFLSIALLRPMGIFGVLFATGLSRIFTQAWYDPLLLYRNVFKRPFSDFLWRFLAYTAITVGCCALTWYLAKLVTLPNKYLNFLLQMVLCLVIPNGTIMLIYHATPEYRDFTRRIHSLGRRHRRSHASGGL